MSQGSKASQNGRMIVVASGKGGVGKTWFAITLAQALARRGLRVLLFDGDLGLANVDVQLGLIPSDLRADSYSLLIRLDVVRFDRPVLTTERDDDGSDHSDGA
jgi:cellulose biosynthesis protein BcsQ